jgi:hypothetical protein
MIKLMSSTPSLRTLSRLSLLAVTMAGLSGCKQISTWTNPAPSAATPTNDPFGYTPTETYFHRPELTAPAPDNSLSPVPDLPAPGHSSPTDLPPSPVPPAPEDASDSVTARPGSKWKLRSMNFLSRKESRSAVPASASEPSLSSAERSSTNAVRPVPAARSTSRYEAASNSDRSRSNGIEPATRRLPITPPPQQLAAPSLDETYTGPVITPGSQYTTGRDVPIESWPHAQRRADDAAAVRLRKPAPLSRVEEFAPPTVQAPSQTIAPPALSGTASMPLLLPPGP